MEGSRAEEAILQRERRALDRWSAGDPRGYAALAADDVTYFDDIGAAEGIRGAEAFRQYATTLEGKIPPHSYDMVDPTVQVYGDTGVLSFRYEASAPDGTPMSPWKATSVYHRFENGWRLVHAHWSLVKSP